MRTNLTRAAATGRPALNAVFCARPRAGRLAAALLALAAATAVSACRQDMHDAPRYDPYRESAFLPNHSSAQPLVAGTVARSAAPGDVMNDDELLLTGKMNGQVANVFPFAITRADLDRGEERFNIYCAPCHGRTGEGDGMVVQRGFKRAANYHIDRLRQVPVGYFFDVMTNGFGVMPDYRAQVPVADRWRIAAYIRALQLSRMATEADVPAAELDKLKKGASASAPDAAPAHGRGGHE